MRKAVLVFVCVAVQALATARAESVVVSNYGVTTNGMPLAVAMDKGFFKEAGVNVDVVLTSDGGGTTIRNLLGGKLAYGEAAVSAVVSAVQGGADLRIISGNVHTVAEFYWVAMPKSPVTSLKDLKGRKLGYTNPRSTSQALAFLIMEANKLQDEVELVRTGGFGAGLTMLEIGGVDVVPVAEPLWSKNQGKYKLIAAAPDILPALSNVVGVTTARPNRRATSSAACRGGAKRSVHVRPLKSAVALPDLQPRWRSPKSGLTACPARRATCASAHG
jgi:NitT/TauT family transport system substrate-binding protein